MTLDEALDLLWRAYTRCDRFDIHTPELIEACKTIVAAHPHARPMLVEYWRGSKFEPDLDPWRYTAKIAMLHPLLCNLDTACGRRWTIDGYVRIEPVKGKVVPVVGPF
jgi:hypothetical protein